MLSRLCIKCLCLLASVCFLLSNPFTAWKRDMPVVFIFPMLTRHIRDAQQQNWEPKVAQAVLCEKSKQSVYNRGEVDGLTTEICEFVFIVFEV